MQRVQKNNSIKIYYKTDNLLSGQTVSFNIWNENGSILVSNQIATEIAGKGVYYIDYTTPNTDQYLLIKGNRSNGLDPRPIVLMNGDPTHRIFFVDEEFASGKTKAFEIYDVLGTTFSSGILDDNGNGFYSTNVTPIPPGNYFFKVAPYTTQLLLPLDLEYIPGECVVRTETKYVMINVHTSKGGASKERHSVVDYDAILRRIDAKLVYESDKENDYMFAYIENSGDK